MNQHKEAPLIDGLIRENNFAYVLVERLKEQGVDYYMTWDFAHYGYDIYEEGVAILSRTPFVSTESFFVSQTTDPNDYKSRKIVKAVVDGGLFLPAAAVNELRRAALAELTAKRAFWPPSCSWVR